MIRSGHINIATLGVVYITAEGVKLVELSKNVSFDDIQKVTGLRLFQ